MATVFLAEDLRHRRPVAVKVLRPELSAAMGAARFRREIEIAAGLHHPHILPLFDSGEAGGHLYFVMPFEEGESLRVRLERERTLSVANATRLMRDVADALAHAHARGVVHRDIKPENILCSGQHALVTDFGIAKALAGGRGQPGADDAPGVETLTQVGTSIGTPAYMAPEQVAGDAATDHRADIYALGVMVYETLAGAPPFTGSSPQQILAAHLSQEPAPLAERAPACPAALAAIVMRCLAKDPGQRWQSAAELVDALEQLAGSSAGSDRASWRWPLVAALALLVAGFAGFAWFRAEGRAGTLIGDDLLSADDLVMVAEFANRTSDTTLAPTVTDAVRIELQESPVVDVLGQREMWEGMRRMTLEPGATLSDAQVRELAERMAAKAFVVGDVAPLGAGYQLTARVLTTVDGTEALTVRTTAASDADLIVAVGDLGHKLRRGIGESLRSVAAAPELARATTASLPALKAYTAGIRAENGGDRPLAISLLDEAVKHDSTFAMAWAAMGVAHGNSSRWTEAVRALSRAFTHRENLAEPQRLAIEVNYFLFNGEFAQAEAVLQQRTELYDAGWISLADVQLGQRRLAEAEASARRGVEQTPDEPVGWWNLVEAQVAQRNFTAAESTLSAMATALPGNGWIPGLRAALLEGRRDFVALDSLLVVYDSTDIEWASDARCLLALKRGMLATWRRCSATRDEGSSPLLVIAELRMTGDTARARQALARIDSAALASPNALTQSALAAAHAEVGDPATARRVLERWRRSLGPEDPRYRVHAPYALAAIALAEGNLDSAATRYLAWNRSGDLDAGHWYNRGLAEAGMVLERAGQPDSARVLYTRALATPSISRGHYYETSWYPQVLRRLGALHEARGEREQALEYYGRLLTLWRDADPVIQRQVAEIKDRVAALSGDS